MALVPIDKVLDTIILWNVEQKPIFDTIIDRFFDGRSLNIFLGRRATIPASSLPALEVAGRGESLGWHAVRVQQEEPSIEIDITTDNGNPEKAIRLESELVSLAVRILAHPVHLLGRIERTRTHLYDSLPSNVSYGTIGNGRMRVATISWSGKSIEYLANRLFQPCLTIKGPAVPVTASGQL